MRYVAPNDLVREQVGGFQGRGHVRWLREQIEPDLANAVRNMTVHGIGYRFDWKI